MNHIIINILSLALTVCVEKQMCISYNNACQVSVTSAQFNSANFIFKKSIDKLDKTLCSALLQANLRHLRLILFIITAVALFR